MTLAMAWEVWQSRMANVAHAATAGLIGAVWQGALLSLVIALGLRLVPKTPAAVRFAIWFTAFVVVAALPAAELFRRGGSIGQGHIAWLTINERWCVMLAAVWVVSSLVRAATLVLAAFRVRALWSRATPLRLEKADLRSVERRGERHAELCVSADVDRPTVIGFLSPKMLIPTWLVERLTAAELEQIVLHEAAHLSRADDWMNLLQKIALVIFPLNPALAWVERRLCSERELACDERVLAATGAPKAYAACLASLAEHRLGRRGLALALGALGRESELSGRIRSILYRREGMRPAQARLVLGGAMLGLLIAGSWLERCPELVGFSDGGDRGAAFTRPDNAGGSGLAYGYQPVIFHPEASPHVGAHVAVSMVHRGRLAVRSGGTKSMQAAGTPQFEDEQSGIDSKREGVQNFSIPSVSGLDVALRDNETQAAQGSVVQLVVVSSSRGEDGARMIVTTFRPSDRSGAAEHHSWAADASSTMDEVHSYAAVPVTDGWLVIQL